MPAMYRTATFADKREGGASVTGEEIFFLLRPVKTAGSPPETHRPMPPACARPPPESAPAPPASRAARSPSRAAPRRGTRHRAVRSEEHTSELQSLMRSSYAVFCLKKTKKHTDIRRRQKMIKIIYE